MALRTAVKRLAVLLLCAMALAACGGPSSSERLSADAVAKKVRHTAGQDGKIYTHYAFLLPAGGGEQTKLLVVIACPRPGECTLISRGGATYPDMQTFVDENDDIAPGDEVIANADPTHPEAKAKLKTYTKSEGIGWGWYAGGGALLVLLAAAGWLAISRRRAR